MAMVYVEDIWQGSNGRWGIGSAFIEQTRGYALNHDYECNLIFVALVAIVSLM
jgi:hypothetical protein